MNAERRVRCRVFRIVPRSGWQLSNAVADIRRQRSRGRAGASIIEYAHDIIVRNTAFCSVGRMQPDHLPPMQLRPGTMAAEVQLAVQPCRRLVGNQPQGMTLIRRVRRLPPSRVTRTIGIAEAFDATGGDFDPAARRRQRRVIRMLAQGTQYASVIGSGGHTQFTLLPERIETGARAKRVGKVLQERIWVGIVVMRLDRQPFALPAC